MLQRPIIGASSSSLSSRPHSCPSRPAPCRSTTSLLGTTSMNQGLGEMSGRSLQLNLQGTVRPSGGPRRGAVTMMGNKGAGGVFAPIVVLTRNIVGEKNFNKIRGQAISLHSQVIKEFCSKFGVDSKQVQGLIRLAKKNGEWLGFLA